MLLNNLEEPKTVLTTKSQLCQYGFTALYSVSKRVNCFVPDSANHKFVRVISNLYHLADLLFISNHTALFKIFSNIVKSRVLLRAPELIASAMQP